MAGIEPVENLSESQITALTCGPTVAIEALASSTRGALQARPLDRPTEKLMTALVKNDLAVPLLILLAQHRQSYVFRMHGASLKTLSSLFDEVRFAQKFEEHITESPSGTVKFFPVHGIPHVSDLQAHTWSASWPS